MELRAQRVLVVDDDGNVRHYVVDLLFKSGFDVVAARDGATARAAIEDARPTGGFDVILLDQRLPDCDGLGLLREMRRNGVETPVVIATAYPEFNYAREAGALGACAYYQKPLFGRTLLSAVRGAILRVPESADAVELNSRLPGGGSIGSGRRRHHTTRSA